MKKITWNLAASLLMAIVFFAVLTAGFNLALAVWSEPDAAPPDQNVPRPLNIETQFMGDVTGVYNGLKIKPCTDSQVLVWSDSSADWICGEGGGGTQDLLGVLNRGADASAYAGRVIIGSDGMASANLQVLGGEIRSKWLHADEPTGSSSIMNYLGVGTDNPFERLDVAGAIKIANTDSGCDSSRAGTLRWTGVDFEGCNGADWFSLTASTYGP